MWIMTKTGNIVTVRPTVILARVYGERWRMWTRGIRPAVVGDEAEHALLFRGARAGAGVALDQSLRRQEILDLLTEHRDIIVFLLNKRVGKIHGEIARKRRTCDRARRAHTLSQSGRFWPKPRHWRRRRMHVSHRPSAFGRSSHF